jgi:ABC-type lipoprotein release transport system permease subunit
LSLPNTYYLDALPVRLNPWIWAAALAMALGLSLLASIYPVRLGKGVSVVQALRYE